MECELTRDYIESLGYKYVYTNPETGLDVLAKHDDYNGIVDVIEYYMFRGQNLIYQEGSHWLKTRQFKTFARCADKLGIDIW